MTYGFIFYILMKYNMMNSAQLKTKTIYYIKCIFCVCFSKIHVQLSRCITVRVWVISECSRIISRADTDPCFVTFNKTHTHTHIPILCLCALIGKRKHLLNSEIHSSMSELFSYKPSATKCFV